MDSLVLPLLITVAAIATFLLGGIHQIGAIRSSCIIGGISYLLFPAQALFLYGATFVGMCSRKKYSIVEIIISSLFYYVIVYFLTQWFKGIGGTLGMSAFLGVLLWQIIKNLSKRLRVRT